MGSLLFALGAIPGYARAVGDSWDAATFFAGSLFFTSAGFLSYREAVDAAPQTRLPRRRFSWVFEPRKIDWWATAVQLAGTLYFNVSCGAVMVTNLSAQAAHRHVWRPDAIGSVCFLVASALAWFEACHGWAAWRPRSWAWWITLINLAGSIAFGLSAVAGYIDPVTGQVRNAAGANAATLAGAVCFFAGALLLLPWNAPKSAATHRSPRQRRAGSSHSLPAAERLAAHGFDEETGVAMTSQRSSEPEQLYPTALQQPA